jgi:putative transcriptional regulator
MRPFAAGTPIDEVVALYAAGALPPDDHRAFEARLAAGWPEAEAELARMEAAVSALAADVPVVVPPAGAKEQLMARLPSPAGPGVTFRFRDDGDFAPTPYPGVSIRVLHIDRLRRQFSALMRLDAGARYPGHRHDGPEECLVLDGSVMVGDVRMRAGDYQRSEAGSDHAEQWTDTGAVVYLTAPLGMLGE